MIESQIHEEKKGSRTPKLSQLLSNLTPFQISQKVPTNFRVSFVEEKHNTKFITMMLTVKSHYRGDIRRFTLNDDKVQLNELKRTLKKLYKLSSNIELSARTDLGQNIYLLSTLDLQKVVQQAQNSTLRIDVKSKFNL